MKVGIEGMYLNIIKAIYNNPTANITPNSEMLKPSRYIQERGKEVLATGVRQEKEIKGIQIGR